MRERERERERERSLHKFSNLARKTDHILKDTNKSEHTYILELSVKLGCLLHPLSFTPYPPFQWYLQSKEILLNLLSRKLWNSAFNAQGLRVIIVVVQVGAVKIYVCSSSGGGQEKRKDRMNLSLVPKLVEQQLVWVLVISFCKIFIPSSVFDALLCWSWPFLTTTSLGPGYFVLYNFHSQFHVWCPIMLKLAILNNN